MSGLIFLIFTVSVLLFPAAAFASNVYINEFVANPSTGNKEWVEFYNPDQVDLSTYYLDDDTDFNSDSGNSSKKSLATLNNSNSKYPFIQLTSSMFNNSGDYVVLFSAEGQIIDQYQYTQDPGKDKSIGRSPDGGSWITLAANSQGATNSDQTPTPTITLTSTTTPSTVQPDDFFTISNFPSQIGSDQPFNISVNLSLPDKANSTFYLKGAFKKADSSNYFGLTKVNGSWVKNSTKFSSQLPITTDSSGNWSGNLEVMPDANDSGFTGTGDYLFKIAYYDFSGNGPNWSNEASIYINETENQLSENNLTSKVITTAYPTTKPTPKSVYKINPVVLGTGSSQIIFSTPSSQSSKVVEVKSQKRLSPLIYLGSGLIISGLGIIAFIYRRLRLKSNG